MRHTYVTTLETLIQSMNITKDSMYHNANTTLYHFYKENDSVNVRTETGGHYIVYVQSTAYEKWKGQLIDTLKDTLFKKGYDLEVI